MTDQNHKNSPPTDYICLVPQVQQGAEPGLDVLEILFTLWSWRWFICVFVFSCTLIAAYVTLFVMPIKFKSNAIIQPSESGENPMSSLGDIGQLLSFGISMKGNKNQIMLNYLNSRELKTWMIKRFDLSRRLFPDLWDEEKKEWRVGPEKRPSVTVILQENLLMDIYSVEMFDDSGLIEISFVDKDPAFAAHILTGVIEELHRYLSDDYVSDARRNRMFVEEQLANAEKNLQTYERQVPTQNMTSSQIRRELAAAITVYSELRRQFELAKIEEDKDLISFKVLDPPLVPEKRSSPQRGKICALTGMVTGFLALLIVFVIDLLGNAVRWRTERAAAKETALSG